MCQAVHKRSIKMFSHCVVLRGQLLLLLLVWWRLRVFAYNSSSYMDAVTREGNVL